MKSNSGTWEGVATVFASTSLVVTTDISVLEVWHKLIHVLSCLHWLHEEVTLPPMVALTPRGGGINSLLQTTLLALTLQRTCEIATRHRTAPRTSSLNTFHSNFIYLSQETLREVKISSRNMCVRKCITKSSDGSRLKKISSDILTWFAAMINFVIFSNLQATSRIICFTCFVGQTAVDCTAWLTPRNKLDFNSVQLKKKPGTTLNVLILPSLTYFSYVVVFHMHERWTYEWQVL